MASRRKKLEYKFVPIPLDVLESPAWRKLTNAARVAYIHIRAKVTFGRGRAAVSVTYGEMEKFMTRKTYAHAIKQLEKYGFFIKSQTGGIFRKRNYYKMEEGWRQIKDTTNGIYKKGVHLHTVENGKIASTSMQKDTVEVVGRV